MLLGTVVAVGDVVLVGRYAEGVGGEVGEEARKGSTGHAVVAVLIAITGGALLWV
jgi:hypothetical protein